MGIVLILMLIPLVTVQARQSKTLYLDWHKVVPEGSGNPNMLGEATVDVNPGRSQVCYYMRIYLFPYYNWPPTGATINEAPAGMNGPEVIDLQPNFGPVGDSTVSDCLNIDKDLAHAIQRNPANYYLLVTSQDYPDGAVRVQLVK
ncbi:MAG: CHRD domain-containing protein [Anaerolineae bacterium]|jgi:hypothetical protein